MPISVVCSSCATKLRAPDGMAGRKTKCPKCGTAVVVLSPAHEILEPTRAELLPQPVKCVEPPSVQPEPPPAPAPARGLSLGNLIALVLIVLLVGFMVWFAVASLGGEGLVLLLVISGIVVWALLPAYLGSYLGGQRSIGSFAGFLLGLLLGWLGLLIVLIFPYQGPTKKCPYCAERVKAKALVCKHCGRDFVLAQSPRSA